MANQNENPAIPRIMNGIEYIQFFPTLRCNLNCNFCFNKGVPATDNVKIGDFEKIIAVLKKSGIKIIDILGGEPSLHPNLIDLVGIINRYRMKTNISSNGTDSRLLNLLSERYDKKFLKIGISLNSDGISKGLHEYIIRHKPMLKSVFTKQAFIPETGRHFIGLEGIEYYLIYMDIVDKKNSDYAVPFYTYYDELMRLKRIYNNLDGVYCSGFLCNENDSPILNNVRCPAGTTKLSVFADGSVYPCYLFFRYKEFEVGNILRDDFNRILQNPVLNFFKKFSKNNCPDTGCALFASCHGGCPAVSYIFHKDMSVSDPRCR